MLARFATLCLSVLLLVPAWAQQRDLFVSSRNTNSVKRYHGETGAYLGDFVAPGAGGLAATQDVAFGPDGHLYVSGRENSAVKKYDRETGDFLGNFTTGYVLDNPTKMSFGPDGHLYVSQWGTSSGKRKIARFEGTTGAFLGEFTEADFNMGMDHLWDRDGRLYVVSYGSKDVRRYDATTGAFLDVFIQGNGLLGPVNLWFGDGGDLFVLDWETGRVQRFDPTTGALNATFLSGLGKAEGFAFGPNGDLFVADWDSNVINRYHPTSGALIGTFASDGGMRQPNGLAFAPDPNATGHDLGVELPGGLDLHPNYPNPFHGKTHIGFTVARPGLVSLTVFDLAGRSVAEVQHAVPIPPGRHTLTFDGQGFPSGTYFYQLAFHTAGLIQTETHTMTVLHR